MGKWRKALVFGCWAIVLLVTIFSTIVMGNAGSWNGVFLIAKNDALTILIGSVVASLASIIAMLATLHAGSAHE